MSDAEEHFLFEDGDDSLNDFQFSADDIEKACSELKSTSAAGPDGVPAILLKTCKKYNTSRAITSADQPNL